MSLDAVPGFAERVSVLPGLTGIAQIYAPRDVSRRQKFRFDRLYIRRQSFRPSRVVAVASSLNPSSSATI